jgi:hypothetical protein
VKPRVLPSGVVRRCVFIGGRRRAWFCFGDAGLGVSKSFATARMLATRGPSWR